MSDLGSNNLSPEGKDNNSQKQDKDKNKKNQENGTGKFKVSPMLIYGLILGVFLFISVSNGESSMNKSKILPNSKFIEILDNGQVDKVIIFNSGEADIYLTKEAAELEEHKKKEDNTFLQKFNNANYKLEGIGDLKMFQERLDNAKSENKLTSYAFSTKSDWVGVLIGFLPFLLLIGVWIFFMRRMSGGGGGAGQLFNIGRSRAKLFDEKNDVKTTFKDVAGLEGAKEEIMEIVEFLKNPDKYTNLGGKIPKGALLVGPPGTGKTLLAKAVAGEAKVPFFSLSGSDFVEMFVGVGASRVRDLFKNAKDKSPAIIFIDEIDAVGRARGKNAMTGANDERENTLNQLLTEMDGFGSKTNVIVLAATNRADVLDKALLRPGRFDRQIYVDLPDVKERKEIFEVHLKPLKKAPELDVDFLSKQTPGFSGADIANVCNEAALIAARNGKEAVDKQDFLDAVDRIIGGLEKKNKIVSPLEKRTIAVHEAGHAVVSWMVEHAAPLIKVTIVPRGQSLGAAWYLPEERLIVRTEQMLDEMCATMGGRAAEFVVFGKISTGALSDLEKVTKQARAMITIYGLNKELGNITYYDSSGQNEYGFTKPYSEDTAIKIDREISKLIEEQYQRAIKILKENKDKLNKLADVLIEKEVIFKDDLVEIFGERIFEKNHEDTTEDIVYKNVE